jgi:Interferon-induced transmembrane protein
VPPAGTAAPPPSAAGSHPAVPNHLVEAILATVCCCLPFGIVSIVYAAQVNSKLQAGDVAGARHASESAKTWAWISFALGIAGGAIYGIVILLGHAFG